MQVYIGSTERAFECRASFQELCAALEDVAKWWQIGERDLFEQHAECTAEKFFSKEDHDTVVYCIWFACIFPRSMFPKSLVFIREATWLGAISEEGQCAGGRPYVLCSTIPPKEQRKSFGSGT